MQYNELMHKARNTMKHTSITETRTIIRLIDNVDNTRVNLANTRKNYELAVKRIVDGVMVLGSVKWYSIITIKQHISMLVDNAIECKNFYDGVVFYEQSYNHHKSVLLNTLLVHENAMKVYKQNGGK